MRIGLLTNYLALRPGSDSGIGLHFRVLADALAALGHQVHVVYVSPDLETDRAALAVLAPSWSCDLVAANSPAFIRRGLHSSWPAQVLATELRASAGAAAALSRAVRRRRLEIVETHATGCPGLAYLAVPGGVPLVTRLSTSAAQLHGNLQVSSLVHRLAARIERAAVRASAAILTHTRLHRDELVRVEGYSPRAFGLVPHGLPDIPMPPAPREPGADSGEEILYVGRFEHRKGVDVLLRAIPSVLAARPRARLTLAGTFEGDRTWPDFAARHPELAGHRVRALGRVPADELDRLYAGCDVFVAPSRYESFGLIYVEAMRHAKPVVGCRVGGVPDVVTDGETGLLTPPGDASALADALIRLLADPGLRYRMGRAGRADFLRGFSARSLARASTDFYTSVLKSLGPSGV